MMESVEEVAREVMIIGKDFEALGRGWYAEVFAKNDIAIKVPLMVPLKEGDIRKGTLFQREIFDAGYSVPEPYGLVKAISDGSFEYKDHLDLSICLRMERIFGYDLGRCKYTVPHTHKMREEAKNIVKDIRDNLGLAPKRGYDLCDHNIIFDERNERVVLADFDDWERI